MAIDWERQEAGFRYVSHALSRMRREPPPPWLERRTDEPAPPSLDDLATAWLRDWDNASAAERDEMRAQNLSDELKARIRELRTAPQRQQREEVGGA